MSDDTRPSGQVNLTMLLSILIVGIIVLAGFYIYVTRGEPEAARPPVGGGAGPSNSDPTSDQTSGSRCGLPGYERQGTVTAAPAGTTWELVKKKKAPKSPAGGPGEVTRDGDRRCFARTAEGAVVAAANIYALSADTPRIFAQEHMVEGPGRDQILAAPPQESSTNSQIVGFRVVEYTGNTARIDIAAQVTEPSDFLGWSQVPLTWNGGDWKRTNERNVPAARIDNLAGFVPWKAE